MNMIRHHNQIGQVILLLIIKPPGIQNNFLAGRFLKNTTAPAFVEVLIQFSIELLQKLKFLVGIQRFKGSVPLFFDDGFTSFMRDPLCFLGCPLVENHFRYRIAQSVSHEIGTTILPPVWHIRVVDSDVPVRIEWFEPSHGFRSTLLRLLAAVKALPRLLIEVSMRAGSGLGLRTDALRLTIEATGLPPNFLITKLKTIL